MAILAGVIPRMFLEKKGIYAAIFSFICGSTIIFLGAQLIYRAF
ncbi:MAG: hypothetical protein Q8R31_07035 [Candidatus Omnitrophota bacterium]|nr:hypothetical protein [Candidatus Omnitrophota bacterium]